MPSSTPEYRNPILKIDQLLHGGDYNPDQWLHMPEILAEDDRLMDLANCNAFSLGIFAWAALEPEEGRYTFEWLDRVMERMAEKGRHVFLSTPSAGMPQWMAHKYEGVRRVNKSRLRSLPGQRVVYCLTSPVYREKCREINRRLAERYKDNPALKLWHISNEFGGSMFSPDCHCDLCQEAFRGWLRKKYNNDLDALNKAWWNAFWSHTYQDWSQIQSACPHGEISVHGLVLDWRRFVTDQTIDFYRNEVAPLREITPHLPATTNLMGLFPDLNPYKLGKEFDIICWDSYPRWHAQGDDPSRFIPHTGTWGWHVGGEDWRLGQDIAFVHDLNRSLKHAPYLLMESTPSNTNWQQVGKLKRPGMHALSSLQAIAHGSESVMYFQWRKCKGGFEKFHGAVVDHTGSENTRVFQEVADVGRRMEQLAEVTGSTTRAEVAIVCDWENRWAIEEAQGPRWQRRDYIPTCLDFYRPFWNRGISVDVIDQERDLSGYKLVIAPMCYMVRPGVAESITRFVEAGGTFVTTYWSGIVDENDSVYLGGYPGPLRKLLGIWAEELESLWPEQMQTVSVGEEAQSRGLYPVYEARLFVDLIHSEGAQVLATYGEDFYAGRPALTVNSVGKGRAYYIASRNEEKFTNDFCTVLIRELGLRHALETELPPGVTAQRRAHGGTEYVFVMNFTPEVKQIALPKDSFEPVGDCALSAGSLTLEPYGFAVLKHAVEE